MLRVVRICIKVPSRCRSVKRAAGRSLFRPQTSDASGELDDPDRLVGRRSLLSFAKTLSGLLRTIRIRERQRELSLRQGDRHPHTADLARSGRIRDG